MIETVTITLEKYDELKGHEFKYVELLKVNETRDLKLKEAIKIVMSTLIDIHNKREEQIKLDSYYCAFSFSHQRILRSLGVTDQEMIDFINLSWDKTEKEDE